MRWFLLVSMGTLAAIGLLNYLVNPEGIYSTRLVPPLLWGSRPNKAQLLLQATPAPQALILGSSRVMNLAPSDFQRATGLVTFNAAVDSAKPEDYYVLLRFAVQRAHLAPRLLFLGVDVESFHDHEPVHYYLQQPTLLGSLMLTQNHFWQWKSFTRLFTQFETGLSLTSLQKIISGHTQLAEPVDADGFTHFNDKEALRRAGQVSQQQLIQKTIERFAPRYDDYTGLSQDRLDYLDQTLRYAHDHNILVVLFLTPSHPAVVQGLIQHGYLARKQQVLDTLQKMGERWGCAFWDMSDPESFGGNPDSFYDGVHYDATLAHSLAATLTAHLTPEVRRAVQ